MARSFTHVIGFDDAPFADAHRGDVLVVGAVYAGERLSGVLSGKVRRDGANATQVLAGLVRGSRFYPQLHAVLLQGIAVAGFNVVDLDELHETLGIPVLVIARRRSCLECLPACAPRAGPGRSAQVAPDRAGWPDGIPGGTFCSAQRAFAQRC